MNFRVYAAGLVTILVYQLAIAAVAIWFVVNCETARGEPAPERGAIAASPDGCP